MKRWSFLLGALLITAGLMYWASAKPVDLAGWPQYEAFRCRDCGGPASINPECIEQWGCARCGYSTYRVRHHFRLALWFDFDSESELADAQLAAGMVGSPADFEATAVGVWFRSK